MLPTRYARGDFRQLKASATLCCFLAGCFLAAGLLASSVTEAGSLVVELTNAKGVKMVGAIQRWDQDGNHRQPVDPKAVIDAPRVDATAVPAGNGKWVFKDLPKGKYDLVILAEGKLRVEGFEFVPVKEFDPFLPPDGPIDDEARQTVLKDIEQSKHYENKVVPLYLTGDKKVIRVLVMLIRDLPTSYTPGSGTIRHEVWQYNWNYGGWQKDKRTKVLDRLLLQVDQLRQWTWLWDPKLGGIEIADKPVTIKYEMPTANQRKLKGLYPY
jgi:hypothetical protein